MASQAPPARGGASPGLHVRKAGETPAGAKRAKARRLGADARGTTRFPMFIFSSRFSGAGRTLWRHIAGGRNTVGWRSAAIHLANASKAAARALNDESPPRHSNADE